MKMFGVTRSEGMILIIFTACGMVIMLVVYSLSLLYRRIITTWRQEALLKMKKSVVCQKMLIYSRVSDHSCEFPSKKVVSNDMADEETLIMNETSINSVDSYSSISDISLEQDSKESLGCIICWSAYKKGDEVCWSKYSCNHVFHSKCLEQWIARKTLCPVCRGDFSDNTGESNKKEMCDINLGREDSQDHDNLQFCRYHGIVSSSHFESSV